LFTARLARKRSPSHVSITLVSEADTFTERPRLHQFSTNQTVQWRSIPQLLRGTGVRFVRGRVTGIALDRHEVVVEDEQKRINAIGYEHLVYALGSLTDRTSVPGVAAYAYILAPRGPLSAAALRETLPSVHARGGSVVVCGGGATGIETAAEFAERYSRLRVHLVTQGGLGMALGKGVADYMRRSLQRLGVTITEHADVAEVRATSVLTAQGQEIPHDICVWAGGFVAPSVAREAGLLVNERGQIITDPFLRSVSHPEVYAVGDAAYPRENPGGAPVRMSAFTATILGAHGADCLSAVLRGRAPKPLSFAYLGQGIALGRHNAIGFNNFPNDVPNRPYFTGQLAASIRDGFLAYLTTAPWREKRLPSFFWLGKRRYAAAKRKRGVNRRDERVRLHQV
jgi:NADH dehydrogenase FAD-containing subunit